MLFKTTILSAFVLASAMVANGAPATANNLMVFSPHITSPRQDMVWKIGSSHNVTWDTSNIPCDRRGTSGLILLGHWANGSENLDTKNPLANKFPIDRGHITVTVPKHVKPGNNYFLVLFGDSGNTSPRFKITKN